jgi:CRISPR-associated endonuclease/helicase Cas3
MANSVIIFDEIQSLPQKCFHMFNTMANFLSQFCNSTILLCSATQIPLNKADLPIRIKGDLLERIETVLPSRTKIVPRLNPDRNILIKEYDYAALAAEIFDNNENALLIVNTKKDALNVYNELKKNQNDGLALFHLSANMCVQNRLDAIGKIKKSLEDTSERTICVSTQLIEAGVDLSFGCVYRVLAGLDSIVQAAGRCNRNGEYSDPKEVYIVKIKDGGLSKLPSIKQAAEITEALLSDDKCREDLLSQYSVDKFYGQILEKNKNEFDYPIKNATLYDLHCCNNKGFGAFRNANGGNLTPPFLRCAFRTVGEEFYLIDKNGVTVYVPYNDEAKRLIARFKRGERSADLFTKLGGYSVNLFQYQVDKLNGGVTRTEDFYFINEKYYNDETGIITDSDDLLLV